MHKPLTSVISLARFELEGEHLQNAIDALLNEQDWQEWINQIELHGLSGFVNKHIDEHHLPIPDVVLELLRQLKERHTAAAEMRYQALSEIETEFKHEGIELVALKGAALASYLYKEPYLRPMRDMDLLIKRSDKVEAAKVIRSMGYDLPDEQPSKFMRDMHQLPNAQKTINGLISSIELHLDGISREVKGHLYFPTSRARIQELSWGDLNFKALEDVQMLHQVARHLEGLHSNAVLKLINVMDVIGLARHVSLNGEWARLEKEYPHVITTLRCLHLLTPLPQDLQQKVDSLSNLKVKGVGQIMGSLRSALLKKRSFTERVKLLLLPSDWWMHLHYNVDPNKSLLWVKLVRHPMHVSNWLLRRMYSSMLGG